MKRSCLAAALAAAVLLASGCRQSKNPGSEAAARPLTVVNLNINPTVSYGPLMIAKDAGFFAEEGIDARLHQMDSNSAIMAFAAGRLDVMSGAVRSGMFNLISGGKIVKVVADRGHSTPGGCEDRAFAAPPVIADRVLARRGDVRGERFVLFRGGINEYLLERLLQKRGATKEQIEIAQMSQGESASSTQKTFEAIRLMSDPVLSLGLVRGDVKVIAWESEFVPGHQDSILLYGQRMLVDDRDLGHRFMRAYLRGVRRYNEGKTAANIAILARYTKFSPEILQRSCWKSFAGDGRPDLASLDDQLRWARERHYLDTEMPRERWWEPAFVEAADKSLAKTR